MDTAIDLKAFLSEEGEKKVAQLSFEQGLKLLEALVTEVETGKLSLEHSVLSYERGVRLIGHLRQILSGAEQKIQKLQRPPEKS